jgi:ubiquinone/menaquinone biosynthesis C-methylase UbiE
MRSRTAALLLTILLPALVLAQARQNDAADAERLAKVLHLSAGSVVAEIGAGSGELTVLIAKEVGPTGRVFSNDLSADRRREIAAAVDAAHLTNVVVVEGRPAEANLPEQCCDAVFMRSVYHHFADPASMNATLFRALKPGGYIAVIDFPPDGSESETPGGRAAGEHHGVTAATVARELREAGFADEETESIRGRAFMVVAHRPSP